MNIRAATQKIMVFGVALTAASLLVTGQVFAHVVVKPGEVLTGTFQTFTVGVPNERDVAVSEIKLEIPAGLSFVTPNVKTGWTVTTDKQGEGEAAVVRSITWSGGTIATGLRDEFNFSAKTPDAAAELQWKAVEIYEDGQSKSWNLAEKDQPKKADGSPDFSTSGPYSITKVVKTVGEHAEGAGHSDKLSDASADSTDNRAVILAAIALAVSFAALFMSTRKRS